MRPTNFDDFIGNDRGKTQLKIATIAARKRVEAVPHTLFVGGAGQGKTTLARIVAQQSGRKFRSTVGSDFDNLIDIQRVLFDIGLFGIWFIDEIHLFKPALQETMLPLIEDFIMPINQTSYHMPPFTVIGATTDPQKLGKPYKDRFKYTIYLEEYSYDEIYAMLKQLINYATVDEEALRMMSTICRNTGRHAVTLATTTLKDFCITMGIDHITSQIVQELMEVHGVYPLGLNRQEIVYLNTLKSGIPQSYASMKARCGADVVDDAERYLEKMGFMEKTTQGRIITREGRRYLSHVQP